MNSKLFTAKILMLIASSALLASCGAKTNPTEGYELSGVPEGTQEVAKPLDVGIAYFYMTLPEGAVDFVEGQPNKAQIGVHTVLQSLSFRVVAEGLPKGLVMVPADPSKPMGPQVIQGPSSGRCFSIECSRHEVSSDAFFG